MKYYSLIFLLNIVSLHGMNRQEAYQILGLLSTATDDEIKKECTIKRLQFASDKWEVKKTALQKEGYTQQTAADQYAKILEACKILKDKEGQSYLPSAVAVTIKTIKDEYHQAFKKDAVDTDKLLDTLGLISQFDNETGMPNSDVNAIRIIASRLLIDLLQVDKLSEFMVVSEIESTIKSAKETVQEVEETIKSLLKKQASKLNPSLLDLRSNFFAIRNEIGDFALLSQKLRDDIMEKGKSVVQQIRSQGNTEQSQQVINEIINALSDLNEKWIKIRDIKSYADDINNIKSSSPKKNDALNGLTNGLINLQQQLTKLLDSLS